MSKSQHDEAKARAKSRVAYQGVLEINYTEGVITFTSGGIRVLRITHLRTPVHKGTSVDLVALDNLTSYAPLVEPHHVESFQEWIDEGAVPVTAEEVPEKSGLAEWVDRQEEHCPVCTKVHSSGDFVKWGPYTFIQAHEYIVWTRNSQQTYAHSGRMQFLGRGQASFKYQLAFNARGPERSTSGRFAGTQVLDARNIVKVEEVDRDPSKRYVDEIDRNMKRDDK